ncbi:MAG: hypothetical protein ACRCY9_01030, partial [Phycicoccus sp.]
MAHFEPALWTVAAFATEGTATAETRVVVSAAVSSTLMDLMLDHTFHLWLRRALVTHMAKRLSAADRLE